MDITEFQTEKDDLRVLYIAHETQLGGATKSMLALMKELKIRGIKPYVLLPNSSGEIFDELIKCDIPFIKAKYYSWMTKNKNNKGVKSYIKRVIKKSFTYYSLFKIYFKIKEINFDLVHSNSSVIDLGGYVNRYYKIPHVWHIREFGEEDHGLYFERGERRSFSFINKYSNVIIAISNSIHLKYKSIIDDNKLVKVYNGVSTEYIQKKNSNPPLVKESKLVLLMSGSLSQGKGQREAIEAINMLKNRGYKNFQLIIAGRGDNDYLKELEELIRKYDLNEYVSLVGYINDINSLRKNANIELVCSTKEAFGRVTIEAMMSSNPVICSNTGANIELVTDKQNGLLYTLHDYHDLADKIEYFFDYPQEISRMGQNALNFAINNFTAKRNADDILSIYNEILNNLRN